MFFALMMFFRLEFHQNWFAGNTQSASSWSEKRLESGVSWMNIFQNGKKIGYTHRAMDARGSGYKIDEKTVMKINTMGLTQDIIVSSSSTTDMDFALLDFNFSIFSGSFDFVVKGHIKDNVLYINSSNDNAVMDKTDHENTGKDSKPSLISSKPLEIKLEDRPYLTSAIIQAVIASGLEPGDEMVLFVFDPSTLGQAPARVKIFEKELVLIDGKKISARKISLSFKGIRQSAWVDDDDQVLKEQGLLGITLVKTTKEEALQGISLGGTDDLTELVSVPSNVKLQNPDQLQEIKFRISGLEEEKDRKYALKLEQGLSQNRQSFKDGILTIQRESLDGLPHVLGPQELSAVDEKFKSPGPFIQSNDHRIKNIAQRVTQSADTPIEKVRNLVLWIQKNIRRQPVVSLPNALSTLKNRMGDCNEHAALMAALCRAIGIPAGVEAGLVYLKGRFYYHAWNIVYIGRWISVDALFNQIPADVTHIGFTSGSQEMQLNLMGVMGKIKLKVISYKPAWPEHIFYPATTKIESL